MVQLSDLIRAIEIIGPLLLSGLLVILYFKQYRIQKSQFQPSIEISDTQANGDELKVWLSNYGGGVAKDMRIETVSYFDFEEDDYQTQTPLHRADEQGQRTRERAIGSEERGVPFVCDPSINLPEKPGMPGGRRFHEFSSGFRQLAIDEVSEIGFTLILVYRDQRGEELRELISQYPRQMRLDETTINRVVNGTLTIDFETAMNLGRFGSESENSQ